MFNNERYRISDVGSTEEELSVAALHSFVARRSLYWTFLRGYPQR